MAHLCRPGARWHTIPFVPGQSEPEFDGKSTGCDRFQDDPPKVQMSRQAAEAKDVALHACVH